MSNIVEVNNISFEYITEEESFKAIEDLSLDIKKVNF